MEVISRKRILVIERVKPDPTNVAKTRCPPD